MAYVSALSHLRYDLNNYIVDLRRIANLAATFLIEDQFIKISYLNEIEMSISDYEFRFNNERNPFKQREIIFELSNEVELERKEYDILRTKDRVTYLITDIFEEHGVLKYTKIAGGVVTGSLELFTSVVYYQLGKRLNLKSLRGVSAIFAAYGTDNIWESMSPLIYEHSSAGPFRKLVRAVAGELGISEDNSDLGYSFVEFSLSLYNTFGARTLSPSVKRLATTSIGRKRPGTGRLFYNISLDYTTKWSKMSTTMKIWNVGYTGYKAKLEYLDDKYKFK
ncbi:DUF4225 domain-containing protein [Salmonella enterica]|nr:DUF4225 domain-containing protein [Salmonella enterica]